MAVLTANALRAYDVGVPKIVNDHPMIGSDIIYEGSFVGDNASGLARPLVAGDPFLGVSALKSDNSAGAASAIDATVYSQGTFPAVVTGFDNQNKIGDKVYASDDGTLTLTSTSNTLVGKILRAIDVSANKAMVFFQADAMRIDL